MHPGSSSGRVAFVVPNYAHDHVRVSHKEARSLHEAGHEVILLCRRPPADTYLGMQTTQARVWWPSSLGILLSILPLVSQALRLRADVYVLTNPYSLPVAAVLALLGKRVVYVTHEDFERKVELRPRIPRRLRKLIGKIVIAGEHAMSRLAVATIATQPDVSRRYRNAYLIENAPLTRGPIIDDAAAAYTALAPPACPTLVYAGVISGDRGLFTMLELVLLLNETRPWRLNLLGPVIRRADWARARRCEGWKHVEYLGQVPHALALAHIRNATLGLGLLDDVGGYAKASITKLYEYMFMGTPFVVSDFAYWRESVRGASAGLFVNPRDIKAIARSIDALVDDEQRYAQMKQGGREFIARRFNWDTSCAPLREVIARSLRELECATEA